MTHLGCLWANPVNLKGFVLDLSVPRIWPKEVPSRMVLGVGEERAGLLHCAADIKEKTEGGQETLVITRTSHMHGIQRMDFPELQVSSHTHTHTPVSYTHLTLPTIYSV